MQLAMRLYHSKVGNIRQRCSMANCTFTPWRSRQQGRIMAETSYSLFSGERRSRVSAGAVARYSDGVVVGSYVNSKGPVQPEFMQKAATVIAQRCGQLPRTERECKFVETSSSSEVNLHFTCDADGRVFVLAVDKAYPARVAGIAVEEFKQEFGSKGLTRSLTCKEEGIKTVVKDMVTAIAKRYEDVESRDTLTRLQNKVDDVGRVMNMNINAALEGVARSEDILAKSQELQSSATVFKKRATQVNQRMWCDQMKMKVLAVGFCLAILVIAGAIIGVYIKSATK